MSPLRPPVDLGERAASFGQQGQGLTAGLLDAGVLGVVHDAQAAGLGVLALVLPPPPGQVRADEEVDEHVVVERLAA
ncbi:hypothetical protein ACFV7R_46745 [Streptomyces sp. NPDC059866]|uniref:hypothetical protein n=1 Tax=Streptomyces sp. NPDC059866 TaxID=3346978 RepID=UPI0036580678